MYSVILGCRYTVLDHNENMVFSTLFLPYRQILRHGDDHPSLHNRRPLAVKKISPHSQTAGDPNMDQPCSHA